MANTLNESPKVNQKPSKPKAKKSSSGGFSTAEIGQLLSLLSENNVSEFELERGSDKIFVRRGPDSETSVQTAVSPAYAPVAVQSPPQVAPAVAAPAPAESAAPAEVVSSAAAPDTSEEISSPMVGTFYSRPSPDADPYVSVGDTVKKGDKLCIIEAMKIMNEIEAEKSGKIVSICLEDGQMAEFGEALFKIEPL